MELEKILTAEISNTTRMNFWREDASWRAYNHSAWFAVTRFGLDDRSSRLVCDGWESVYISLSDETLDVLLAPINMVSRMAERIALDAGIPFDVNAYYRWKSPFAPVEASASDLFPGPDLAPPFSSASSRQKNCDMQMRLLWQRVRDFDLCAASPAVCADFVRQLKDFVEDA